MMAARVRTLEEYLNEFESKKEEKPEQVKDGIEIYVDLWRKAMEKGVVEPTDGLDSALEKVDRLGGLYRAAEE